MSAIDDLRRLLDEHGARHSDYDGITEWCGRLGAVCRGFQRYGDDHLDVMIVKTDPGSAIAATLVSGTCRNEEDSEGSFLCSECGAHMYRPHLDRSYTDQEGRRWYTTDMRGVGFRYCPSCGKRIENEEGTE